MDKKKNEAFDQFRAWAICMLIFIRNIEPTEPTLFVYSEIDERNAQNWNTFFDYISHFAWTKENKY